MLNNYESLVNSLPSAYTIFNGFGGLIALYMIGWGWADSGRFGDRYYRDQILRNCGNFLWCVALLWPVPLLGFVWYTYQTWGLSEFEIAYKYENDERLGR